MKGLLSCFELLGMVDGPASLGMCIDGKRDAGDGGGRTKVGKLGAAVPFTKGRGAGGFGE